MPLYDYTCDKCHKELHDIFKRMCEDAPTCCEEPMRQIYDTKVEVFDTSRVFEHCDLQPRTFRSKSELKRFCKEKGLISHYLEA